MKSPAATAALSSVRARTAADRAGRSLDEQNLATSPVAPSAPIAASARSRVTPASANTPNDTKTKEKEPKHGELAMLRREASTILRALRAARAAPGGLRGAFGDDAGAEKLFEKLLDALCRAGMVLHAADALREAIDSDAKAKAKANENGNGSSSSVTKCSIVTPAAVETVVRHAARAGRCRESGALDAFLEFRKTRRAFMRAEDVGVNGFSVTETPHESARFPTLRSYTDVISALGKAEARRRRFRGGDSAARAASDSVAAVDVWRLLEEDFAFLQTRGDPDASRLKPDGAAYTAAAAAFLAADDEASAEALIRAMRREGIEPGARLYNVLIAHFGYKRDVSGVRETERRMAVARVRPNAATHGARVAAYCRCGELVLAETALNSGRQDPEERNRPTVRAYTALVQAFSRAGDVAEIDRVLRMMRTDGVSPNCHTYTVAVDGLVERGNASEAERFVRDMRAAGIQPSAVTYNCLLKSCVGAGTSSSSLLDSMDGERVSSSPRDRLRRAERVLREMREDGVATTVVTYNTLIDACVCAGEPTESMFTILSALVDAGHRPDVVTYTTLLKHFGKRGDVVAARWLMREMENDAHVRVDASALNALIDAFGRGGLTREAVAAAARMRDVDGREPDTNTYGALLDGFARVGDDQSAASLYAALRSRGEGADKRGWSPSWVSSEANETVKRERVGSDARPDARMRAAVVAACAASVAKASALDSADQTQASLREKTSRLAGVVEAVIADAAASDAASAAAEAVELRKRWRRESTGAGIEAGRTVRRVRANARGARGGGVGRFPVSDGRDELRAGCPVPVSWGSPKRDATRPAADAAAGSRRERRRDARDDAAVSASGSAASSPDADGVTRGFEMWKHWLGLPSRYYANGEGSEESPAAPMTVAEKKETVANADAAGSAQTSISRTETSAEKKYTRAEIADAVRVLRAAASRKFPDDPETALRAALDAAGEGDAKRVAGDDERA
jgi:leucine-rich PPR motif-containing protein